MASYSTLVQLGIVVASEEAALLHLFLLGVPRQPQAPAAPLPLQGTQDSGIPGELESPAHDLHCGSGVQLQH